MAKVVAVCISKNKGEQKHPIEEATLKVNHGILGDAHAGNWHRQVSLLGIESVEKLKDKRGFNFKAGDFAENILTQGICLYELQVGTRIRIGETICEVTQIGKVCQSNCKIKEMAGDCVMPREGIFAKVIEEGKVKADDCITVL